MATWPDGVNLLEFVLNTVDLPDNLEGRKKANRLILVWEDMLCDTLDTIRGKTVPGKTWPAVYDAAYDELHAAPAPVGSVMGQPDEPFVEPPEQP